MANLFQAKLMSNKIRKNSIRQLHLKNVLYENELTAKIEFAILSVECGVIKKIINVVIDNRRLHTNSSPD